MSAAPSDLCRMPRLKYPSYGSRFAGGWSKLVCRANYRIPPPLPRQVPLSLFLYSTYAPSPPFFPCLDPYAHPTHMPTRSPVLHSCLLSSTLLTTTFGKDQGMGPGARLDIHVSSMCSKAVVEGIAADIANLNPQVEVE
jgi:hypothetical protein